MGRVSKINIMLNSALKHALYNSRLVGRSADCSSIEYLDFHFMQTLITNLRELVFCSVAEIKQCQKNSFCLFPFIRVLQRKICPTDSFADRTQLMQLERKLVKFACEACMDIDRSKILKRYCSGCTLAMHIAQSQGRCLRNGENVRSTVIRFR